MSRGIKWTRALLCSLRESSTPLAPLWLLIIVISGMFLHGYHHADEIGQITAFYLHKLGIQPTEHMPWEMGEAMRPWFQPAIYYALIRPIVALLGYHHLHMERLAVLVQCLAVAVLLSPALRTILRPPESSHPTAVWGWRYVATLWFVPSMLVRHSSEAFATILLAASLIAWNRVETQDCAQPKTVGLLAGLAAGGAFCSRFQMMAFVAPFWLARALVALRSRDARMKGPLAFYGGGVIAAVATGFAIDWWGYGEPVVAPWRYFVQNIVEDRASSFGVEPWYYYVGGVSLAAANPLLFAWLGRAMWTGRSPWLFSISLGVVGFLGLHFCVAHKELRFLFPMVVPAAILIRALLEDAVTQPRIANRLCLRPTYLRVLVGANCAALLAFCAFGLVRDRARVELALWKLPEGATVYSATPLFVSFGRLFEPSRPAVTAAVESELLLDEGFHARTAQPFRYAFVFAKPPTLQYRLKPADAIERACREDADVYALLTNRDIFVHPSEAWTRGKALAEFPPIWLRAKLRHWEDRMWSFRLMHCSEYPVAENDTARARANATRLSRLPL